MNRITKSKTKVDGRVKLLTFTAMFAALIAVMTAFIKIPTALGYSHAGDSIIYLAACILPGPYGFVAASIGGAIADIISGYAIWAIPTAIIKPINVLPFFICRYFLKKADKDDKIINLWTLLMIIPTTIVTVGCYFVANCILYDFGAAVAELVTWYLQPGVGMVLFIALGAGLDAIGFKKTYFKDYI